MATKTENKPAQNPAPAPAKTLAQTLREIVNAGLAALAGKSPEEIRLGLVALARSVKETAPAYFGTVAERKAHLPVFSSDKETRKAQMKQGKADAKAARSVLSLVKVWLEEQGIGTGDETFGLNVSESGNVTVRNTQYIRVKRTGTGKVTL